MRKMTLLCCLITASSCKILSYKHQYIPVELAMVGRPKANLFDYTFEATAIPVLKQKIRLRAKPVLFTQAAFKTYTKAVAEQGSETKIQYHDSLLDKPRYVRLHILDKVRLINELNNTYNRHLNNYLKTDKNALIITAVDMSFDENHIKEIQKATAVFLIYDPGKGYMLELLKDKASTVNIHFSEGISFAYKTASFCWNLNEQDEIAVADLVKKLSDCPKTTYKEAGRAKEEKVFKNYAY